METLVLFDIGRVLVTLNFERFYEKFSKPTHLGVERIKERLHASGYGESMDLGDHAIYHRIVRDALDLGPHVSDSYIDRAFLAIISGKNSAMVDLKQRMMRTTTVGLLSNSNQCIRSYIEDCWPTTLEVNGPSVFSDEIKALKPDREIYDAINTAAERIIFIDDVPKNLLYPSTALGWQCIRYSEFLPDEPVPVALQKAPRYQEARTVQELEEKLRQAGVTFS